MSRVLALCAAAAAIAGLVACVQEAGQVAPPTTQPENAAPTAAAVNASAQRALAEAAKARAAAQRAEAAAQFGRTAAATAESLVPRPAGLDPGRAWYRGEKPDGSKTIHGVVSYPDGGRYEGQFIGTKRDGVGVHVTADGARYAGEWREDLMAGHGSVSRANTTERYDGEWQGARRNGHGLQIDATGNRYAGQFRDNRPQGLGVLFDPQGKPVMAGNWDAGRQPVAAPANPAAGAPQRASYGSGFVVSASGAVVTNEHVVRCCTQIDVRQEDGSFARASLVRSDIAIDLAVIDMARPAAAVAPFRDSGTLREGEEIVVYGFPFAARISPGGTVTSGIVSSLFGLGGAAHQLQITAPVQIGNSGGPLLDRQGRVVGIVQSKLNALSVARATGDLPQNVNFAVKSARATTLLRAAGVAPAAAGTQAGEKSIADIVEAAKRFTVLVRCQR